MNKSADVAIIGGGILGLAHAYVFAREGKRVALFERGRHASGASIRNFGMVWPIGQPAGEMHALALRSRDIWLDVLRHFRLNYRPTGSLHVAYRDDEAEVLREFADVGPAAGYTCRWLTADQTLAKSDAVRPMNLQGALWSDTELTVDPRDVVARLPECLSQLGVEVRFGVNVHDIDLPSIRTSAGTWNAERAVICGGDDFSTLYPMTFADSGVIRCKLQMMRTAPQPDGWQLGPSLAAGLTLRFYKAFRLCTSLARLRRRIAEEQPEYERWAIHVLVSQTADGAVTLGDSHEYGTDVDVFDKTAIDDLIVREAAAFLRLPDFRIAERWHGVYALHLERPYIEADPAPGVRIVAAPGGSGMTLSFGLAERTLRETAP
jgi:FAD dependent oxidoreductase TIGR03364